MMMIYESLVHISFLFHDDILDWNLGKNSPKLNHFRGLLSALTNLIRIILSTEHSTDMCSQFMPLF